MNFTMRRRRQQQRVLCSPNNQPTNQSVRHAATYTDTGCMAVYRHHQADTLAKCWRARRVVRVIYTAADSAVTGYTHARITCGSLRVAFVAAAKRRPNHPAHDSNETFNSHTPYYTRRWTDKDRQGKRAPTTVYKWLAQIYNLLMSRLLSKSCTKIFFKSVDMIFCGVQKISGGVSATERIGKARAPTCQILFVTDANDGHF